MRLTLFFYPLKPVYYWLESYGLYDVLNSILRLDIKIDKKAMQKKGFGGLFISQAQLEYSATDVYYLPKLYNAILQQQPIHRLYKPNPIAFLYPLCLCLTPLLLAVETKDWMESGMI